MKLLRIPRTVYQTEYDGEIVEEVYFGGMISTTAEIDTATEWDSTASYNYMDKVRISALNTTYIALIDNPTGHPSVSTGWLKEGDNKHKMLDATFSSASRFDTLCEVEFDVSSMTHVLGRGIMNVKNVFLQYYDYSNNLIDAGFNCDTCDELESVISMYYNDEFNCFSCCNPDPVKKESFALKLNADTCERVYKVKIIMEKIDDTKPIYISTLVVADSYDLGCVQRGFEIEDKIPSQIKEYPELKAIGIRYANMTTNMRGSILVDNTTVDKHRRAKNKYGGYLNYYLFDELDSIETGLVLGISPTTSYKTNTPKTTMNLEVTGVEH